MTTFWALNVNYDNGSLTPFPDYDMRMDKNTAIGKKVLLPVQCTKSMKNCVFLTASPLVYFVCTVITHTSLSTKWGLKLKVKVITPWIAIKWDTLKRFSRT